MIVEKIQKLVKARFDTLEGSHDWFHIERVLKMSLHIREAEGGNMEVIQLAALLHDISDHKYNGGDFEKGKVIAYQMIIDQGGDEKLAHSVSESYRKSPLKGH